MEDKIGKTRQSLILKGIEDLKELVGVIITKLAEGDKKFAEHEKMLEQHWQAIQQTKEDLHGIKKDLKKLKQSSTFGLLKFSLSTKVFLATYFMIILGLFLYVAFK